MKQDDVFEPMWASPPGETIRVLLDQKGIPIEEFAEVADVPADLVEDLLIGATKLTRKLAESLSVYVGGSPAFWIRREEQYRAAVTRRRLLLVATEIEWTAELPLSEMINMGWMPATAPKERFAAALAYFGVGSLRQWRERYGQLVSAVSFRTSPVFSSHLGSVLAWLRQGELQAEATKREPWSVDVLKAALPAMRALTRTKNPLDFLPQLQALCAAAGVALVLAPAPKACRASGATWFGPDSRPICLLSYRYRSDDQFWFTFFHEIGHLVLHSERALFLEDGDDLMGEHEAEANTFSQDVLLPPYLRAELTALPREHVEVIRFARRAGVSPGIVVGQMQHLGLVPFNWLNKLKRRYDWSLS